jgi:hypothetical protein
MRACKRSLRCRPAMRSPARVQVNPDGDASARHSALRGAFAAIERRGAGEPVASAVDFRSRLERRSASAIVMSVEQAGGQQGVALVILGGTNDGLSSSTHLLKWRFLPAIFLPPSWSGGSMHAPFLCAQGVHNRIHHLAQIDGALLRSGFASGINARINAHSSSGIRRAQLAAVMRLRCRGVPHHASTQSGRRP